MADVLSFNGFIPASIKKEDSPFPFDFKEFKDRAVNVKWFGAKGDGVTDDTAAIRAAFADAMSQGKSIYLGHTDAKYKISESIVIDRPLTIYAHGTKSIIEQTSWGVPCLEIRSSDVKIIGTFKAEINTPRTLFDSTALANSKNNDLVKSEAAGDPSMAGTAIYCRGNFDNLYIEKLDAKGFISGILLGGDLTKLPEKIYIGCISVENVDFGVHGNGFRNLYIGVIQAKNILRSQGADEHALYFTQSKVKSEGAYIGAILCNGIETFSHIVTVKSVKDIYIGVIRGENIASFFTSRLSNGYIGSIQGKANKGDNLYNSIDIQDDTDFIIDNINIESQPQWIDASNRGYAIAVGAGGNAIINNPKVKITAATPSAAVYCSGAGRIIINNPIIEYVNTQTVHAFRIATTTAPGARIFNPELIGGSLLIEKLPPHYYEAIVDPNKIRAGITSNTFRADDGVFYHTFSALSKSAFIIPDGTTQPNIKDSNIFKTNNTSPVTINLFTPRPNGKEFILIAGDANTTIQNNSYIKLKGGVNLTAGSWSILKFICWDNVVYEI